MLTDAHRPLLASIEAGLREAESLKLRCIESEKRIQRLKSAKFLEPATRELNEMETRIAALEKQTNAETTKLFKEACGITMDGIGGLYDVEGNQKGLVIVEMMRARQLDDGTAVMSIGGATVDTRTEDGNYSFTGPSAVLVASEHGAQYLASAT